MRRMTLEEAYLECENLLHHICHKHQMKYGGDYEDLFDEAIQHFIAAWERWDPNKGTLATWVRFRVSICLYETVRRAAYRNARLKRTGIDPEYCIARGPGLLETMLMELSEDATTIIHLVVEAPSEFAGMLKSKNPRRCRPTLRCILDDLGWPPERVDGAFAEISSAL